MIKSLKNNQWEALSAYLDGQLSVRERQVLEEQLRSDTELQMALDELRQMQTLLRSVPRFRAPRNFTLSPKDIPQRERWLFPVSLGLAFSSAVSVVFLFLSFFLQPSLALPVANLAGEEAVGLALASDQAQAESSQPQIIFWGSPQIKALGMGGGGDSMAYSSDTNNYQPEGKIYTPAAEVPESLIAPMEITPEAQTAGLLPSETPEASGSTFNQSPTTIPSISAESALTFQAANNSSGPILGVPAQGEEGQIIVLTVAPYASAAIVTPQNNPLRFVLAGFALLSGLGAFLFFRRSRL